MNTVLDDNMTLCARLSLGHLSHRVCLELGYAGCELKSLRISVSICQHRLAR